MALLTFTGCGLTGGAADDGDAGTATATSAATTPALAEAGPTESAPAPAEDATGEAVQDQPQAAVEPGGTLVDGSTVSAELTRAGQKDTFTLDLGDARELYVTDTSGDEINFQVLSEVDDEPAQPAPFALISGSTVFQLTKAGAHRVEVWGDTNVVGAYGFRIATVKVRTFPATLGLKIGEGSPDGAGRLDVPGRIDRFEFDADGATAIKVIGGAGACGAVELELVDAAERRVSTPRQPVPLCGYEFDIPLANGDGRYALIVRSGTAKTGPYSFQLVRAG
jgi:hypothetical protein